MENELRQRGLDLAKKHVENLDLTQADMLKLERANYDIKRNHKREATITRYNSMAKMRLDSLENRRKEQNSKIETLEHEFKENKLSENLIYQKPINIFSKRNQKRMESFIVGKRAKNILGFVQTKDQIFDTKNNISANIL